MRWMRWLVVMALGMGWLCGVALAGVQVRVVQTWPEETEVVLPRNQNFYLRLAYDTDAPVRLWARPYWRGKPVAKAGSNPSGVYAGAGEALGWFFLFEAGTEVDEVRISAGDGTKDGTRPVAVWRGHIRASSIGASSEAQPAWVSRMLARDEAERRAAAQERANRPATAGDTALVSGFGIAVLGLLALGLGAPVWAFRRWQGGWRLAAAVPMVLIGFVVLRIIVGTSMDPTSHNLWPFEIVMAGGLSALVVGVLALARRVMGAHA